MKRPRRRPSAPAFEALGLSLGGLLGGALGVSQVSWGDLLAAALLDGDLFARRAVAALLIVTLGAALGGLLGLGLAARALGASPSGQRAGPRPGGGLEALAAALLLAGLTWAVSGWIGRPAAWLIWPLSASGVGGVVALVGGLVARARAKREAKDPARP